MGGEIKYNPESVIRAVRDAFPAQTGVLAAQLAKRGVRGFAEPLEGKAGFFKMFARDNYDPDMMLNGLGDRFEINHLSFKQWPSCRGTHVFIDLMARGLREHRIKIEDIVRIETAGNTINRMLAEPLPNKQQPTTSIDAKFSIPYCVAWTAVRGEPTLKSFLPDSLKNDEVIALAKKVSYAVDSAFDDSGAGMLSGRMTIVMKSGDEIVLQGNSAPGDPEQPLNVQMLREKFEQCCSFAVHKPNIDSIKSLADSILSLEKSRDLESELFKYL